MSFRSPLKGNNEYQHTSTSPNSNSFIRHICEYLFPFYSFQPFHGQTNSIVDNFEEINTFLSFLKLQIRRKSSTFAQIWTIESGNNKIIHSTIYLCTSTSPFI